jgi:hypothetical protein
MCWASRQFERGGHGLLYPNKYNGVLYFMQHNDDAAGLSGSLAIPDFEVAPGPS